MLSPNLPSQPPSSVLRPKNIPDSPVLMTIALEPSVRHSTISGKETIVNVLPPPHTTHSEQPLNSSPAKSTNLLQRFVEDFKEVDSYR